MKEVVRNINLMIVFKWGTKSLNWWTYQLVEREAMQGGILRKLQILYSSNTAVSNTVVCGYSKIFDKFPFLKRILTLRILRP